MLEIISGSKVLTHISNYQCEYSAQALKKTVTTLAVNTNQYLYKVATQKQ